MRALLSLIFLLLTNISFARTSLEYSDELIRQGDLFRALTVLKEIEYNSRGSFVGFKTQKKIVKLHLESEDFEGFDYQVKALMSNYSSYLKGLKEDEIFAEVNFIIGNKAMAFNQLYSIDSSLEKKYLFRAYAESENYLPKCESQVCSDIAQIEGDVSRAKKQKNEYLALGLGIIPGAGQVYAGNIWSGVGSFLLNGFFIATSVIAFNNHEQAMGFASSVVGGTFYLSSIYAGYETARRYNSANALAQKKRLESIPIKLNLMNLVFD